MDAAQEARVAEINAALRKRGADEVTKADRRALVDELSTLLTGPAQAPAALAPEKQARADQITARLRDHALGKPDAYLDPFERGRLVDELHTLDEPPAAAAPGAGAP